jgi:hypothetical protein
VVELNQIPQKSAVFMGINNYFPGNFMRSANVFTTERWQLGNGPGIYGWQCSDM